MKKLNKMRFIPFLLTLILVVMMAVPSMSMAAEPVTLGTTAGFAVLAGSTITNTGTTTISGDVGVSPGAAFTGQESATVSGAVYLADVADVASTAQTDLVAAYTDAAGRTPATTVPSELGGTTLTPGTYNSADGTFQITGTLTLDAQGAPNAVFIFQAASTLTTASDSSVVIINNGAPTCQIIWKVGSSATLGTGSSFVGHILALASITANTGATVQGQLLALNGAVTLDRNTITNVGTTPSPVDTYAVTIEWGDMTFSYDFGTWNPDNHTWGGLGWKSSDFDRTKAQVKITNHSTQPINATFSYEADQTDGGTTTGTFTKEPGNLNGETTDTMTVPAAEAAATYLNLQGRPASIGPTAKKVGTITVKIGP